MVSLNNTTQGNPWEARPNDGYENLLAVIRERFRQTVTVTDAPVFTTGARDLYGTFLQYLPEEARQHYNCNACRDFVNRYGGLVTLDKAGHATPVMWDPQLAPEFFRSAVLALYSRVEGAAVTGVFITSEKRLGTPVTGPWRHMAVDMPAERIHRDRLRTAWQVTAEKAEDYRLLGEALGRYSPATARQAVHLLRTGDLYRSEKVLGVAEWFLGVHSAIQGSSGHYRNNRRWRAVATAPAGFCHVSSSMIGTLLDDIQAGLDTETVRRKFAEKMNPLQYQRPQAAPTAGNVAQAEKIVEQLGLAASLRRRYARVEELRTVWTPREVERKTAGVFAGVKTKTAAPAYTGTPTCQTMTWEKFARTVLPEAREIKYLVPHTLANYAAIVTAADPDAPPLLQWDREDDRNPFSWYVYNGGSPAQAWNLMESWADVTAVTMQPSMWTTGHGYQGQSVFFILRNCQDLRYKNSGLGLFPEILRGELREVRATIEAYSRQGTIEGAAEATACGLRLQARDTWRNVKLRVVTDLGAADYVLDRWD